MGVRSYHKTITLTGSAQQISAIVGVFASNVRWLSMQPGEANTNPVYLGGSGVSASDYGTRLPAASGGIPPPPHVIAEFQDGTVSAEDFYVIGTAAEKLHLHVLAYT